MNNSRIIVISPNVPLGRNLIAAGSKVPAPALGDKSSRALPLHGKFLNGTVEMRTVYIRQCAFSP
jgi:hypothetical protein